MSFEAKVTDYGQVDTGSGLTEGNVADIITLAVAKNYIKQQYGSNATEDALIAQMITSARQWIEGYLNQTIIKKGIIAYTRDEFAEFALPFGPVQTISEVVRVDYEGNETAMTLNSDYYVDGLTHKRLLFYHVWSTVAGSAIAGVKVTYTAYMDTVPQVFKDAVCKIVAENYYHRGESEDSSVNLIPFSVRTMLNPFKRIVI